MMLYLRRHFDSLAEAQAWKLPSNISFCMAAKTTYQQKQNVCVSARAQSAHSRNVLTSARKVQQCAAINVR